MEFSLRLYVYVFSLLMAFGLPQSLWAQQTPTLESVQDLTFKPIRNGGELELATDRTGRPWIRGHIDSKLSGKSVVLQIPSSHVHEYELYLVRNGQLVRMERNVNAQLEHVRSRFPQYRFVADPPNVYYIHVLRQMQQHPGTMQVSIQSRGDFDTHESRRLYSMGVYYGLALMSVVFNLVFYLAFRDKRFIMYCGLLFTTFLSSFCEDGLIHYFSDGQWSPEYLIVWSYCTTAVFSLPFTYYFLSLESVLRPYRKWYWLSTGLLIAGALVYTATGIVNIYHGLEALCLLLAFVCVYLAIRRFRRDVYARFLVFAYSLLLLTAVCYVMYLYSDPEVYKYFDIGTFRMVSGMEIIIISFAIIFKVKALQEQNERYRNELDKYLRKLEFERSTKNIEVIEKNGSKESLYSSPTKVEIAGELRTKYDLTDREVDVLLCIWEGLTNNEIAEKLFVSLSTVKYHVSNLYTKLDVKNRNQIQVLRDSSGTVQKPREATPI